ncbi:MAG: DUF2238 domain-containing protein [Bacillota bacterium]
MRHVPESCRMNYSMLARLILAAFTLVYIIMGTVIIMREGNTEFLAYMALLLILLAFGAYLVVRFDLPLWMPLLISVVGALHLAGGGLMVHGDVLYNLVLIPIPNWTGLTVWKFDQLVHPYGAFVVALITYALLARTTRLRRILLLGIAFMVANGAGALNEVVEFITKVTVPHTDVGGYYNTALDLFFNMLGAFLGSVWALVAIRTRQLDIPPVDRVD